MSTRTARRNSPAVNAGSMADIAFLLLIFFLVTTTIAEERGVLVRLPEWSDDPPVTETSEALTILLNGTDELLVEDRRATVGELPGLLRRHVLSPSRTPKQAVVSLTHDRSTSYTRYLQVYDGLLSGYHQLWNEAAERRFGSTYAELSEPQRGEIRAGIPMVVSEAEPVDHGPAEN